VQKKGKVDHIVLLRSAAILLVVLGHVFRDSGTPNIHFYEPIEITVIETVLKKYIYSFHMPLFFWIAGYVHYLSTVERSGAASIPDIIAKKVRRLLIPYFSTSLLILIPVRFFFGHTDTPLSVTVQKLLIGSGSDHLWFLYSLFLLFIFFILLQKTIDKLPMAFGVVLFFLISSGNGQLPPLFRSPCFYSIFFYAGFESRKHHITIDSLNPSTVFPFVFLIHAALLWVGTRNISMWGMHYAVAFTGICFCYYASILFTGLLRQSHLWRYVHNMDAASMTIYLFHVPVLYIFLYMFYISHAPVYLRILLSLTGCLTAAFFIHRWGRANRAFRCAFGLEQS